MGIDVFVGVIVAVGLAVKVVVGVDVLVNVEVKVAVGRGVRVGEGVHVGRGVLVGVRVHTIGVRVKVGVADNAAMKARIRSVLTAEVERATWATSRVAEGTGVAVGAG